MNPVRLIAVSVLLALLPSLGAAEPYLAVETGFKCNVCHAKPTGGGLRSPFGNIWAQTEMSARRIGPEDMALWTGQLGDYLAFGGDIRGDYQYVDIPHQGSDNEFETQEARFYLQAQLIPQRLAFYVDERVAPGSATNLEANARLMSKSGQYYLVAGRLYLPFGWRLEDDNAFVKQVSGVNMQTPDEGLQVGMERGSLSAQATVTNGSGGGPETNDGKQATANAQYVRSRWRLGVSGLFNNADGGDRKAVALYGGLRLGPTSWLGEVDYVDDNSLGTSGRDLAAALIEVNWRFRKGQNVKFTYEWFDPDTDVNEDEQTRTSLVYELSPIQFLQLRCGVRVYDGPDQIDAQNQKQAFIQLHGYF